jgi:glycine dehydrogenase
MSIAFESRHIGPSDLETSEMLSAIGVSSLNQLIDETIPASIRQHPTHLTHDVALSEADYLAHIKGISHQNIVAQSMIGLGYYGTVTPPVILRNVFENPGWYTQYTPYQAEISQGRLEMLFNYQTMVCDLTGLDIANASLLDEATAAAEAMTLLYRVKSKDKKEASTFLVDHDVFPHTLDVLIGRGIPLGITVKSVDLTTVSLTPDVYGILVQNPSATGCVKDYSALVSHAHSVGVLVAMATDLMALTLVKSPGEMNVDIAIGSAQRFGVPMGFGGPHAAFIAVKDEFKRQLPGRVIGVSIDRYGNPAYRMALQTREQHIRRDKATSNICTAQALLANMAAMYAVYHGPSGLKRIATAIHHRATRLADLLLALGYKLKSTDFFDTVTVTVDTRTKHQIIEISRKALINFREDLEGAIGIALDELSSDALVDAVTDIFASVKGQSVSSLHLETTHAVLHADLLRTTPYLTQAAFNTHHSESQMMRYLSKLMGKDLSLTHSMIPLGSCTMKLNAAVEMLPVSLRGFSQLHPFAPSEQTKGYQHLIGTLEKDLATLTGFDATSLQPNSGAQGELAGLLVIKAYLESKGEGHRTVALIPSSAHGTNPATATMAGMTVITVACDNKGNIDITDLRSKAAAHHNELACLMVTYPSTHGVFEESIQEICQLIHEYGGQVYMDGANMNAQVGLTSPGAIGADVCHLNLHKTFCIPHGGGGPGVGPICVASHLTPFLPGHRFKPSTTSQVKAVSAAPFGSASILLISYAYILLMGLEGLANATRFAILNANYIKARLQGHFQVLYTGNKGHVAHELIIDCRAFKKSASIEVEDIAKRLIDYGFHAPTMSWPVPGTLMIEPTESEDKAELDRFCDAMISIKAEIDAIAAGNADAVDNVLKNAPHTAIEIASDDWAHCYGRVQAAYPLAYLKDRKFWPSVGRVDNAYGDRNLVCSCS